MKADLVAEQQRLDSESEATIGETEQLVADAGRRRLAARRDPRLPARHRHLAADDRRCARRCANLRSGNFDVVLPGLGRKDEIGEMAGAVEEFKVQAVAKAERDAAARKPRTRNWPPHAVRS